MPNEYQKITDINIHITEHFNNYVLVTGCIFCEPEIKMFNSLPKNESFKTTRKGETK